MRDKGQRSRWMRDSGELKKINRRMEHEHGLALENKLNALNREHERTVELMQQREQKMANELEQFRREKEGKRKRKEGETQTEEEEGEGEEEKGKEMELEEVLQRAQRREQQVGGEDEGMVMIRKEKHPFRRRRS